MRYKFGFLAGESVKVLVGKSQLEFKWYSIIAR